MASVVVGDGLVVLLLRAPGVAPAVVGRGVVGVEPDGLVVVGDGLVVFVLVVPGEGAVVVIHGLGRVRPDPGRAVVDGLVDGEGPFGFDPIL